jgi:hypothetical protein
MSNTFKLAELLQFSYGQNPINVNKEMLGEDPNFDPADTWLNDGSLVYRCKVSGVRKGDKGQYLAGSNEYSFLVQADPTDPESGEKSKAMAAYIADLLRKDTFKKELCSLQAQGLSFYLIYDHRMYYNASVDCFVSARPKATLYDDAIELIHVMDRVSVNLTGGDYSTLSVGFIVKDYVCPLPPCCEKFVVLKSLATGTLHYTNAPSLSKNPLANPLLLSNGRRGYDLVAYVDTQEEAEALVTGTK